MIIAYNNSEKHFSPKNNFETPDRTYGTIKHLLNIFPKELFLEKIDNNIDEAIKLIENVHCKNYIQNLKNMIGNNYYCKNCLKETKNKCTECNDNSYYTDNDTYQTPESFEIIIF